MTKFAPHIPSYSVHVPRPSHLDKARFGPYTYRIDPPLFVPAGGYALVAGAEDGGPVQVGAYGPDRQLIESRDLLEPDRAAATNG